MTTQLVTLGQVKAHIGNAADATDDAVIQRVTDSVCSFLESACNRTFAATNYAEHRSGNGGRFIVLNNYPVTAITSLEVNGVAIPASTSWDEAGWVLSYGYRIDLRGSSYAFHRGEMNVVIAYSAGYAQIPGDLQHAALVMAAIAYKERDRFGITSKSVGGESVSFLGEMPDFVQRVVREYARVMVA